jgi:hypothetical protein
MLIADCVHMLYTMQINHIENSVKVANVKLCRVMMYRDGTLDQYKVPLHIHTRRLTMMDSTYTAQCQFHNKIKNSK